jgi:NDP-sugar pyrophosphorylase family protein
MNRIVGVLLVAMLVALEAMAADGGAAIYELRTYTTHDGRLPALEARFRDHTMRLFEKHGMTSIGYWIPVDRPNTLIYMISHASRDAVEGNWKAFIADPEWREVARESQKDGPILVEVGIESKFMTATDYSPIR